MKQEVVADWMHEDGMLCEKCTKAVSKVKKKKKKSYPMGFRPPEDLKDDVVRSQALALEATA